jgi:hypothetical protein
MKDALHFFWLWLYGHLHTRAGMFKVVQYLIFWCFVMHRKQHQTLVQKTTTYANRLPELLPVASSSRNAAMTCWGPVPMVATGFCCRSTPGSILVSTMMAQPPLHLMSISVSLLESCGLFGMDSGTTFLEIINYMHHNTSMHRAALIMLKIFV